MFKQQNSQLIFNRLQDELAEYDRRLKEEERTYEELLQIRKEKLKESEVSISRNVSLYEELNNYLVTYDIFWA